jgi:bud site selection protein 31
MIFLSHPFNLQYDFLVREKIADGALISKWRKPGYEILCSTLAIQRGNHNFGTTSHCRVPMKKRAPQQKITPDVQTGCICCASGDGRFGGPIWWNTPMEDTEETAAENRAVWVQVGADGEGEDGQEEGAVGAAAGAGAEGDAQEGEEEEEQPVPSRKRPLEDDEDELDDDVKKRLAGLRG